ncbi:MAG: hypothetical protein AB1410_02640 [Acidobacteriota bacterium]
MKKFMIFLAICFLIFVVFFTQDLYAEKKYNPFTGKWETTTKNAILRYNAFEGTWSYEKPDSITSYNPFKNKWEWKEKDGKVKYNAFEDRWETAPKDSILRYNPFEDKWEWGELEEENESIIREAEKYYERRLKELESIFYNKYFKNKKKR